MRLTRVTQENKIILLDFSTEVPISAKARKTDTGNQWKRKPGILSDVESVNAFEGALQTISALFDEPITCGVRDANPAQLRIKIPEDKDFTVEDVVQLLTAMIS